MAVDANRDAGQRWGRLMRASQQGDQEAYRRLLEELLPVLRGMVRFRVFDPSAAEDVVQNILLSLHRARHTYRSERPFRPWLNAIARNAIIDFFRESGRRRAREVELGVELIEQLASVEAEVLREDGSLSPALRAALAELPAKEREAVELIQLQGLSVAEAAVRAGVTSGALKVRAHRGYRALRRLLEGAD